MKNPNPNMLLRIAQADAYAMAVEYLNPEFDDHLAEVLKFEKYHAHPSYHHTLKPGMYTDDTQMSLAVAEVLTDESLNAHGKRAYQQKFFECFKRDPRDGYSRGFQKILETSTSADHMVSMIVPDSDKNGAAMRSVPIGVMRQPYMVRQIAALQAAITHNTPNGILSSQAVALMSHFAIWTDDSLSLLPKFLQSELGDASVKWDIPWNGRVVGPDVGINTARAVCTLVSQEQSLMDILKKTIEWGGDTDSVGAIAWGVASARMKESIPDFFEFGLETGRKYGIQFLRDSGQKLIAAHQ